jgi:hypothetical protein
MKILYIGRERRDAEAVATALRGGIAQNVTLLWAQSLDHVAKSLDDHQDLAALVVDAQIHAGEWPSSLRHLRSLPRRPAVVVVVPEGTQPEFESLGPPADGYLTKGHTFLGDLPVAVTSAVTRIRGSHPPTPAPSDVTEPQQHVDDTPEKSHGQRRLKKAFEKVCGAEQASASKVEDQFADSINAKSALERRLADVESSSRQREQLWSVERAAAAERQEYLDTLVHRERSARVDFEQKLADTAAALEDAKKRHAVALARERKAHEVAAAEQLSEQQREHQALIAQEVDKLAKREADLISQLTTATTSREHLESRLAAAEAALVEAGTRVSRERLAASTSAAEREAALDAQIRHERALRVALEQAVADANAALCDAQQRHDAALATAATELAERQAHLDRQLSETASDRDRLGARLNEAELALHQAQREYELAALDIDRLQQRDADLSAQLANDTTSRNNLERQLAVTQAALEEANTRATRERLTATEKAAAREAELDEQIWRERVTQAALEQAVADADAALRDAQQRHEAALAAAAAEFAERKADFDRALSQTAADRARLTQRLSEAEIALDQARRDHQSSTADIDRLTQCEADLTAQLSDAQAARQTLESKLAQAVREIADASECAARERAAAENRYSNLEARLEHEIDAHETLKQTLSETRSAALDAERLFREEAGALRAHTFEREAHFEARLASERLEHGSRLTETQNECERLEQARAAADAGVQRLSADLSEAKRVLADTRRELQDTVDRLSGEHATALAALTTLVAERDERLKEQAVRHEVALRASERARTELRERLEATLASSRDQIEHVQEKLIAAVEALETTKRRQEVLQTEADRVLELQQHSDQSREESHQLGEQAELTLVRRTQDGTHAKVKRVSKASA